MEENLDNKEENEIPLTGVVNPEISNENEKSELAFKIFNAALNVLKIY